MQVIKRIYFLSFFFLLCLGSFSQTSNYNNTWINYNLKYYKVKIANDGIYKLDSNALAKAGIPLLNPMYIRMFQKGKELYPYIQGEADGVLNTNDFVLFYATKNNGEDDSSLYYLTPNAPFITNPFYSITNDTSVVFFTYDSTLAVNKRLSLNPDTNYTAYNPSPYYIKEVFSPYYDFVTGPYNVVNQNDPRYLTGEGWLSAYLSQPGNPSGFSNSFLFNFNTQWAYPGGAYTPNATICLSGANDIAGVSPDHTLSIGYQGNSSMQTLGSYSLDAYNNALYHFPLNASSFNSGGNSTISVNLLPNSLTSTPDYVNVNYIKVDYPQTFNMLGQTSEKLYLPDDLTQSHSKLTINNFNNQSTSSVFIDNNNHRISFVNGSSFNILVANSGSTNFCYLSSLAQVPTSTLLPLSAVNGTGLFVDYLTQGNLDSAFVIISHPTLINAPSVGVSQYALWRKSGMNGGNYNVLTASIMDLYDQFAYGVELNPIAIKNFCGYLINNALSTSIRPPSNLFLMGKGVHAIEAMPHVTGFVVPPPKVFAKCMVPSWGNPSNDALFTVGLPGSLIFPMPAIPTGRLAAQSDQDVLNYLSKAQVYAAQPNDSLWRKQAIHFIGGANPADQSTFASYMSNLKYIYQQPAIGGNVYSFYKTSSAPISTNTDDSVKMLINQGVSLMTFFGHGSPTGFDQNIDAPTAYNNPPRIPFIIANSCFTGDIFSVDQLTNSEEWVLAANDKGSIGYIATTAEGVAMQLFVYTSELYKQFTYKNYGMPYGYCMQQAIKNVMGGIIDSTLQVDICMEMTLHGDPATKANTAPKPDYAINNAGLIFDTKTYPTDSIGLSIVMTNLAKAVTGVYNVKVMRVFPNGDTTIVYKIVPAPYYKDTLHFFMYENYTKAVGINNFFVTINYMPTVLTELNNNYANNSIGPISLFIRGSDIEPVYPYQFEIVPNIQKVTLKASTADAFAPLTTYVFQMDTSAQFNSSVLTTTLVSSVGGLVTAANLNLLNKDSVVYYWRVAKDTSTNLNWKQSSFQVLTGKYGWGQAHFFQFDHDGYQYVQRDSLHRKYNFVNDVNTIQVKTAIYPGDPVPPGWHSWYETQFFLNNIQEHVWSCGVDGWTIGIFNPVSGDLVYGDSSHSVGTNLWLGTNGNCICDNYNSRNVYDFGTMNQCQYSWGGPAAPDWRPNLANLLDTLKPGTPVIAYTVKASYSTMYQTYPVNPILASAFHSIGSTQIDNLQDSTSLIVFGKKGMSPGQAHEVISTTKAQQIILTDTLVTHFNTGYIASPLIGPAQKTDTAWKSLHWHYHSLDADPTKDSIVIQLIGVDSNGIKTTLANFTHDSLDVLDLGHYASGKKYPYLQLIAYEADNTYHTPPQLTRWQVIFDPVPECALYPAAGYSVVSNNLNEGNNLLLRMPIKNISDFPFKDSLLVTYYIVDANRNTHPLPYKMKRRPFLPDSTIIDTITVSTMGYAGANYFGIDVNPPGKPKYQLEQYHFNNIAQIPFTVVKDNINPILDVTFDGTHILNGDIVSAKPDILISLKDENKFLALNDTSDFMLYVTSANSSTQQRIYFNNPQVQFTPAVLPNNSCKINYKPNFVQDGVYTLNVQATDRSGNFSGQFSYKIQFEIINKPMITEVLNYPNPFSTSTKFVFTLTGTEVPDGLLIQIMTITGKVVKEITREELGYLHIGRNITEYAWDGKDEYGGKLANGVYFYRVTTRLNGNALDHMNTSADEYFKKGIGKMVIMR
ncbi:MAG: hypothetical protein JST67_04495 [Bacteroidetes bacterium]|nr:hypothetical protein [Bacteroidota bacterium]